MAMDDETREAWLTAAGDGSYVEDSAGGIWHPDPEAEAEIKDSEDPQATALRIALQQPMRGTWAD